jgi:hypothetical protein
VDRDHILGLMKAYLEQELPPEQLLGFPNTPAAELLDDSIEVLSFVLHLDGKLGIEIPLDTLGPHLTRMNFLELADELCLLVNKQPALTAAAPQGNPDGPP